VGSRHEEEQAYVSICPNDLRYVWERTVGEESDKGIAPRHETVPPDISAFLEHLCRHLQTILGDQVIGIYLYGSAAVGDFVSGTSDIDLIVVCRVELSAAAMGRLHHLLTTCALPSWLAGVDCSILSAAVAARPQQEVRWEADLQVKQQAGQRELRLRDRLDRRAVLDLAMARERGQALIGPAAQAIFAPVPPSWLRAACLLAITIWAGRDVFHDPASGVLQVCRAWRYVAEGILGTKSEGGTWACSRVAQPALIEAALAHRHGLAVQPLADADVKAFCQDILQKLECDEDEHTQAFSFFPPSCDSGSPDAFARE
jgi:hypothetical protein